MKLDTRQLEFDVLFDALPDVVLRDQRDALERPLVSLSKNIRTEPVEYRAGELVIRILPHQDFGQPTIWDYDIIIYLLGQVNERFRRERDGKPAPSSTLVKVGPNQYANKPNWKWNRPGIEALPTEILRGIRRVHDGKKSSGVLFSDLRAAIARLQTCVIETNLWHGRQLKNFRRFTLIHEFEELEPSEAGSGGMRFLLPEWMIESVRTRKGILAISPAYFDLTGGFERFLYRIARKVAGRQEKGFTLKMATLHERSGSAMDRNDFAKSIRRAIKGGKIPDYTFTLGRNHDGEELVNMVWNRGFKAGTDALDDDGDDAGNETPFGFEDEIVDNTAVHEAVAEAADLFGRIASKDG
ncbi:replication initiator protein A [Paramagnetospirillum kuznetsovii]|uniref:replication initiator protein A n=1 Tax=Paramagnetospirillum kuznetsovii TaxID=2053833 RepID=UPI001374AB4D|nr:replication initiator protein A [Paramagnetospirillum kuznetsovii]